MEVTVSLVEVAGRVQFQLWDGWLKGGVILVNSYLYPSEGLSARNRHLLLVIAEELARLRRPYVWAGDFQVPPEVIEASGLLGSIAGAVVAPDAETYVSGSHASKSTTSLSLGPWSPVCTVAIF